MESTLTPSEKLSKLAESKSGSCKQCVEDPVGLKSDQGADRRRLSKVQKNKKKNVNHQTSMKTNKQRLNKKTIKQNVQK